MNKNEILILELLLSLKYEMYPSIQDHYKFEMNNKEFSSAFAKLIQYNFIEWFEHNDIIKVYVRITMKGKNALITNKNQISETQKKSEFQNLKSELELENLKLQNENLLFSNSLRNKDKEVRELTIKNLKLQNRELKQNVLFAVVGFILAYLINNIDKPLKLLDICIPEWLK
jgi:DNA-binding PadR family transcriptional regulator